MWAQICLYDFYNRTNRTRLANRARTRFLESQNDLPPGAKDVQWFKNWFLPIYEEGKGPAPLVAFFAHLAQEFPMFLNDGKFLTYSRRLNLAEYVHFMSAATGKDQTARAATTFGAAFKKEEFENARVDFAQLNPKYPK
ncbi:hypothetical protein DFS34DRAFT_124195 [Phlyctochytrium arcticum]|nr:hypothetical protein DFS34DRAFT_124195 [Phlyctochytrium arcticum]